MQDLHKLQSANKADLFHNRDNVINSQSVQCKSTKKVPKDLRCAAFEVLATFAIQHHGQGDGKTSDHLHALSHQCNTTAAEIQIIYVSE